MENYLLVDRYRLFSFDFVKAYLITMRPYLMFVSGITGIVGLSFSNTTNTTQILLIFLAALLSYGFGQALTDCFQTDTDAISSPYRPLTQNLVSKKSFLIISGAGLCFCVTVFGIFNPINLLFGFIAGIGLATYTFFKRRWWGGPFYNAWIVADLFIISFLAGSSSYQISTGIITSLIAVFFGYSNFVLSGYFKDIKADMKTGYNTLPVKFGREVSAWISDFFSLAFIGFITFTIISIKNSITWEDIPLFSFYGTGLINLIYAQIKLHKVRTDEEAHVAIAPVVHGYILLLSAVALSNKPFWFIYLAVFYAGYLIILKCRPAKEQI